MTSNRPYLIRAIYEWIADNNQTPYLVVDTTVAGVIVPKEHIENGQIVLNITFQVVKDLSLGNDNIQFSARFGGVSHDLVVPVRAVKALYAKESGEGMGFSDQDPNDDDDGSGGRASKSGGHLRVVK